MCQIPPQINGNPRSKLDIAAEVHRTMRAVCVDGHRYEIRAFEPSVSKTGSYPDDADALVKFALEQESEKKNVYIVLNPLLPAPLGGQPDDKAAKAKHVQSRLWLFVDVDPERPKKFGKNAATEAERAAARTVVKAVSAYLDEQGITGAIATDSGNRFYWLVPISLPNDEGSYCAVENFLGLLGKKFDTAGAKIDKKTKDAGRLARLLGTTNRKGPANLPDRPHRRSRLLAEGDGGAWAEDVAVVNTAIITRLASEHAAATPPPSTVTPPTGATAHGWHAATGQPKRRGKGRPPAKERARAWMARRESAVAGNNGHDTLLETAEGLVNGFLLPDSEVLELLQEYSGRCSPPWSEHELQHKLAEAIGSPCDKPRGWLLEEERTAGQKRAARGERTAAQRAIVDLWEMACEAISLNDLNFTAECWDIPKWSGDRLRFLVGRLPVTKGEKTSQWAIVQRKEYLGPTAILTRRAPGWTAENSLYDGSRPGLYIPCEWSGRGGPLLVVCGPEETAACAAAGLNVVGRPIPRGGWTPLERILRAAWPPGEGRDIIVVGENDPRNNGATPGRSGAKALAENLAIVLGRPVWHAGPPEGVKSIRDMLAAAGARKSADEATWGAAGQSVVRTLMAGAIMVGPYHDNSTPATQTPQEETPTPSPTDTASVNAEHNPSPSSPPAPTPPPRDVPPLVGTSATTAEPWTASPTLSRATRVGLFTSMVATCDTVPNASNGSGTEVESGSGIKLGRLSNSSRRPFTRRPCLPLNGCEGYTRKLWPLVRV